MLLIIKNYILKCDLQIKILFHNIVFIYKTEVKIPQIVIPI